MIHENAYAHETPDRRHAESETPTQHSIMRALDAQRRERNAFTEVTGIPVDRDGKMGLQFDRAHLTTRTDLTIN